MLTQLICSAVLITATPDVADDETTQRTPFEKYTALVRGQTPEATFGDPAYGAPVYSDPFNNSPILGGPWGGPGGFGVAAIGQHRHGIFGDFLFLSARGADVPFATPVAGMGVPAGQTVSADPEYEPGFRAGFNFALTPTSSLRATYWWYESSTTDALSAAMIRPDAMMDPSAATFTTAGASYDIDFQKVDLDYVWVAKQTRNSVVNYIVGLRYGHLEQDFRAAYATPSSSAVVTDVDFDGVGPRIGLEGERNVGSGFLVYGLGTANFLLGEFRADYVQNGPVAAAGFTEDRIVPVLELEAGVGWQDPSGTFRVTAGYLVNAWFNAVTTPDFINAVQASNFTDVDDTLSFDGLTVRVIWNF